MHQIGLWTDLACSRVEGDDSACSIQRGCSHTPANKSIALCIVGLFSLSPSIHWKEHTGPPLTKTLDATVCIGASSSLACGVDMDGNRKGSAILLGLGLGGNIRLKIIEIEDTVGLI